MKTFIPILLGALLTSLSFGFGLGDVKHAGNSIANAAQKAAEEAHKKAQEAAKKAHEELEKKKKEFEKLTKTLQELEKKAKNKTLNRVGKMKLRATKRGHMMAAKAKKVRDRARKKAQKRMKGAMEKLLPSRKKPVHHAKSQSNENYDDTPTDTPPKYHPSLNKDLAKKVADLQNFNDQYRLWTALASYYDKLMAHLDPMDDDYWYAYMMYNGDPGDPDLDLEPMKGASQLSSEAQSNISTCWADLYTLVVATSDLGEYPIKTIKDKSGTHWQVDAYIQYVNYVSGTPKSMNRRSKLLPHDAIPGILTDIDTASKKYLANPDEGVPAIEPDCHVNSIKDLPIRKTLQGVKVKVKGKTSSLYPFPPRKK